MPAPMLCAHRCAAIQGQSLQIARDRGLPVEVVRIGAGLVREYVPLDGAHTCTRCTAVHTSPLAAAECCDPGPTR